MSKLKKLIKCLCPNGVKYKRIEELAEVGTGSSNRNEAVDDGKYPFFVRSNNIEKMNTFEYDEEAIIIPGEGGIGDIFHYINGKYALHQRVYRIHFYDSEINTKFMYYYFSAYFKKFIMKKAVSATVTSIRKPMIEKFFVPIPPIKIQNEIVQILDNFIELEAKLEAELKARKKQYGYYRKKLINQISKFKIKNLEECCIILDKKRKPITRSARLKGEYPYYGANGIQDYVSNYIFDGQFILVGEDGSVVDKNGNPIVNWAEGKIWVNNHAHIIKESNVDLRYLYYYIQIVNVRELIHGNIPKLNQKDFRNIKIKVPTLEEQKKIVSILDRFDKLCNDISEGLPAEIEARKKQYEYYRDKLLDFKELKEEK